MSVTDRVAADTAGAGSGAAASPLGFTETAREAWHLYRQRPLLLIPLFAALYLVVALLALLAVGAAELGGGARAAVGFGFTLGVPVAGSLVTAIAVAIMHDGLTGQPAGLSRAAGDIARQWKEVLAAALLAAALGLLLFVPPLSLIAVLVGSSGLSAVLFGPPMVLHAIVLERRSLAQAWRRARDIMSGNWVRLVLYWLALGLAVTLLGGLLTLPAQVSTPAVVLANGVVLGVLIPYVAAFVLASFLDARSHHDRPESSTTPA